MHFILKLRNQVIANLIALAIKVKLNFLRADLFLYIYKILTNINVPDCPNLNQNIHFDNSAVSIAPTKAILVFNVPGYGPYCFKV